MPDSPVFTSPEIVEWRRPGCPTAVEYSPDAFERLRIAAIEGLLALPRVGMGIGGLLLGTHTGGRIRVLDSVAIPCSHAQGPSFHLSQDEREQALQLVGSAAPLSVVGWYCSRTRGKMGLSPEDIALFDLLCAAPWQITLLLRPSLVEPTRAALFYRDKGKVLAGSELELLPAAPAAAGEPAVPEEEAAAPLPEPEPEPQPMKPAPLPAPPPFRPPAPAAPRFTSATAAPEKPWRQWIVAAALLCFGLGGTAWLTRYDWMPRPPLKLEATDSTGQITFRWNTDAVRGLENGMLLVNDGGELHTFPMAGDLLERGFMRYDRKSRRVTGTLRVGETRVFATFFEPEPATKPSPPAK